MPGIPSNKACERCKKRHIKCDEARPGCQRCASAGAECPGYSQNRKFIDEGASVRRRYAPYPNSDTRSRTSNLPETAAHQSVEQDSSGQNAEAGPSSLAAESLVSSTGPEQANFTNDLNNQNIQVSRAQPESNTYQMVAFPEISTSSENTTPNQTQQPVTSTQNTSFVDDMRGSRAFNSTYEMNPSIFYDGTFDIPLDFGMSTAVNQPTYPTPLPSNSIIEPRPEPKGTPDLFSELMMNSEREMSFLMRHYVEFIAPWLDCHDSAKYFGTDIPRRAIHTPSIQYAAMAVAAKHLGRLRGVKPLANPIATNPATTEVYPSVAGVDWFFKASNYYHQSLSYLRQAVSLRSVRTQQLDASLSPIQVLCLDLGLDPGSLGDMRSPIIAPAVSVPGSAEDILAAVLILTISDILDIPGPEWESRLLGVKPLLEALAPPSQIESPSLFPHGIRASLWNFAHLDYLASYINRRKTKLDPDNLNIWCAAGIPLDEHGKLRLENTASIAYVAAEPDSSLTRDDTLSHALTWLQIKMMNFIAEFKEMQQATQQSSLPSATDFSPGRTQPTPQSNSLTTQWLRLTYELQNWFQFLPDKFQPYLRIESPHDLASTVSNALPFPECIYSTTMHAATVAHYNLARIILLLNRPHDAQSTPRDRLLGYREVTKDVDACCREIAGIAMGRPPPAVRIHLLQPLFVMGQCYDHCPQAKALILELMRTIETDCGWATEYRVRQLQALWDRG